MKLKLLSLPTLFTLILAGIIFAFQIVPVAGAVDQADLPRVIQPTNGGFDIRNLSADAVMQTLLRNAIQIVVTICSIGVIMIFLWGATDWVISGGDKEKVAAARKKITSALIGFVLLALSFAIIGLVGSIAGINPFHQVIPFLGQPASGGTSTAPIDKPGGER